MTGFSYLSKQLTQEQLLALTNTLNTATQQIGIDLTSQQQTQLLTYLDQLLFWNKTYNLTAITQPKDAFIKHIVDCLVILPWLPDGDLLDVGTGAGLPAIIIAICDPSRHCSALDSNQKKIRFIKQMASQLKLNNLTPIVSRIEDHNQNYQVITSRAFASLQDFIKVAKPCLTSHGTLCAMKGQPPTKDELLNIADDWQTKVIKLNVPFLQENRHLVNCQRLQH